MKGSFKLTLNPNQQTIQFCNLSEDGSLFGYGTTLSRAVAHDVIEHNLAHRKLSYITVEAELKALGAVQFVRGVTTIGDVIELLWDLDNIGRKLKKLPWIVKQYTDPEYFFDPSEVLERSPDSFKLHTIKNALRYLHWGYIQKSNQFNGTRGYAESAFHFVKYNMEAFMKFHRYSQGTVYFYFDTAMQIWRENTSRLIE